ncbi:TPA: hypothetical protein RQJ12_001780, partial [Campylobacter fetus subsp. venerealis]|nr:hypothetical protein [Campylobacter fetus subsp. venerealis]
EIFSQNKILLKNLKTLDFGEFSKKRTYKLFIGIDKNSLYTLVFMREAKSKFIKKELDELVNITKLVETKFDTNIKKLILLYRSQICSKVIKNATDWKFYAFM